MSEAPQLPTPSLRHSRFAKSDDGVSSQRDVREKRKNTASSVGVALLTIGGTMSEAPRLPTPSLRHSRFAKSDDGVSSQRDVREKRKDTRVAASRSRRTAQRRDC
jgi:hypothetical protein